MSAGGQGMFCFGQKVLGTQIGSTCANPGVR